MARVVYCAAIPVGPGLLRVGLRGVNPPVVVLTLKPEMLSELLLETNRYSLLDSVLGCIANDVGSDPVGSYTGLSRVSAPDEVVMRYPNTWLESSHNT